MSLLDFTIVYALLNFSTLEIKEKIIVLILASAQIPGQMLKPLCG